MKFELITPELIQMRESVGLVKDVYDPIDRIREPISDYKTMLDLVRRDQTISRAFEIIVDFATHRGYDFIGGNKKNRDELRLLFNDTLNFKQVLPNLIYTLLYYGDGFVELRKNNSKTVNELWVLETTEMRIQYDEHGKVGGYWQRPFSFIGLSDEQVLEKEKVMGVFFKPDEVVHFRMKWIGSQVYSYNSLESGSTVISTKQYATNYLMNIFLNMPPRYVAHLAGINKSDYELAKKEFQSAKTNYKKTIAFSRSNDPQSKLAATKIDAPYDKDLLDVMRYLESQVLSLTGVPRSWLMESGTENRGATEAEQLPFYVKIKALHNNILEPPINLKMLPALGKYKKPKETESYLDIKFNEVSIKRENEILMNLGLLRDMGLKPDAMVSYLDKSGLAGLDPDDFEEQQTALNMELNPSRQRMDKGMKDMTQNRNERGVSEESGKKMGITNDK